MSYGPIELLLVEFPGSQFTGEITPALEDLTEKKMIKIIDIVVVHKARDGDVTWLELADEPEELVSSLAPLVQFADDTLLSDEDLRQLAESMSPGSTAAAMVFENVWATRFANAINGANGRVVLNERIPRSVVDELTAGLEVLDG